MATKSGVLVVGDEAVSLLLIADMDSQIGSGWTAYNAGETTVWTGDRTVTVGNGIPIPAGGYAHETIGAGAELYGIAEDDTQLNIKQDGV